MRKGYFLIITMFCYVVFILFRCANPIAPTGGEKDVAPPNIVPEKSTPNFQTNFRETEIILTFDEWIKLDKPNQIVTSPPFKKRIKTELKGKSIEITLPEDEPLKDSITYTINFGDAIQDITESNKLTNYRFVFSTGPHIDSLSIQGKILDAESKEPLENITAMLHADLTDSIIYQSTPYYFAKTNKNGDFKIENVKAGSFRMFALSDADQNYIYNPATEQLGFLDSLIQLPRDLNQEISLTLFKQNPEYKRLQVYLYKHHIRYVLNRTPADLKIVSAGSYPFYQLQNMDTLEIWHQIPSPDTLFIADDYHFLDTLIIIPDSLSVDPRAFALLGSPRRSRLFPGKAVPLIFNRPVTALDTGMITLLDSASMPVAFDLESGENQKILLINASWQTGFPYRLQILPGSINGWGGFTLADTLDLTLAFAKEEDFGTIKVKFPSADSAKTYMAKLLNQDKLVDQFTWEGQSTITRSGLNPGSYTLRIFADINQNTIWDPGHYLRKINPEPVLNFKIDNLRANWEMEVPVSFQ